jgi:hypothetical protein
LTEGDKQLCYLHLEDLEDAFDSTNPITVNFVLDGISYLSNPHTGFLTYSPVPVFSFDGTTNTSNWFGMLGYLDLGGKSNP